MAKAEVEIQSILSSLTSLYWRYTDTTTGLTHKPHGMDWIYVKRNVYRLLLLRGTINMGDRVPEDPWVLFLSEYAPVGTRHSVPTCPSSILLPSSSAGDRGNGNVQSQQGGSQNAECDGRQQQQRQRRIRFIETPSPPARGRAPRRLPLSPAPNSRFN